MARHKGDKVKAKVQVNDIGISLTPVRKHGRSRPVGTAILSNVDIKDGISTGVLVGEYPEVYPLMSAELPGPVLMRMKPLTDNVSKAKIVYAAGREIFYLPE